MTKNVLPWLILVLAFLGIADAWYLTQSALTDTPLVCDIGGALDGCNIVAQSPYSHLWGAPLALYGVFFYALIFIVSAVLIFLPHRLVTVGLFALSSVGLIASAIFIGIQLFLIHAICLYCFASAGISLCIFICALVFWRHDHHPARAVVATPWDTPPVVP